MVKRINFITLVLCMAFFFLESAQAQKVAVKTNLLYDATSTLNLGLEFGLSKKWTLDVSGNYNPWTFNDNRKMKHWLAQPEFRYWLCEKFNGHFFGLHAHGGQYNWGGMLPWGFSNGKMFRVESRQMSNYRYEGWLVGAGISYGYQWILGNRWNLEASIGVGYTHLNYGKYKCEKCGEKLGDERRNYFGPTKAAISIIYIIK